MNANLISADSHVMEPPEVFAGLAERFGDKAPRVVTIEGGGRVVTPNAPNSFFNPWNPAGASRGALRKPGRPLADLESERSLPNDAEFLALVQAGYAAVSQMVMDPVARATAQDTDGVLLEVLYPTYFLSMFRLADADLMAAAFRNYNDWIATYAAASPDRLLALALIPMLNPEQAEAELRRVVDLGFRGACLPCTSPDGRPYSDPAYDRVWSIAEEAELSLAMHVGSNSSTQVSRPALPPNPIVGFLNASYSVQPALISLICQGVAHRFPRLRFVVAEFDAGWLPHWLQRLDHSFQRTRASAPAYIDLLPSEYWRRQFYATFEDDRAGALLHELIGTDTLMWSSDYPHPDCLWPYSQLVVDEICEGLPLDVKHKLSAGNAARLYKIALPVQENLVLTGGEA